MIVELAVETKSVPAAWFDDNHLTATLLDVLRVRAEEIDKSTSKERRKSSRGR